MRAPRRAARRVPRVVSEPRRGRAPRPRGRGRERFVHSIHELGSLSNAHGVRRRATDSSRNSLNLTLRCCTTEDTLGMKLLALALCLARGAAALKPATPWVPLQREHGHLLLPRARLKHGAAASTGEGLRVRHA